MRQLSFRTYLAAAVAAAGLIPVACGGGGATGGSNSAGTGTGSAAGGASGHGTASTASSNGEGGCFANCSGGGAKPSTLAVSCDTLTIDVLNGTSTPAHCVATVDGNKVGASWVVDVSAVAGVDAAGTVTATGTQGGDVAVKAAYEGDTATAQVKVTLKKVLNPDGFTDPDKAVLTGAVEPDVASVVWAYPYNGTVFPKGLLPPEMMWNGSSAGDKYYVHVKGKYADFEYFTTANPPSRYTLDDVSWQQLTESGPGGDVSIHVTRMPAGSATAAVVIDHTWKIANGSLRGTVYYWSNNLGRVVRIKPGALKPDDFLKDDVKLDYAGQPKDANGNCINCCTTCHAVSANGSTLVIGGDFPATTIDLLTNTVTLKLGDVPGKVVRNWAMPAISPNGKVLIENNAANIPGPPGGPQGDGMWNTATGQKITGTGLDGIFLGMPAFAPNGTKIAYVDRASLGLNVYDYDATTNAVQNAVGLVPAGTDPSLKAIAFPSVSPDAKWITYHRGEYPNSLDTRYGPGDLYLASVDQPGVEIALSKINGDKDAFAAKDRDLHYNYEPTFAPVDAGGFAWVVFTSRRTLGNKLIAGKDSVKQLWVAALDQSPQAGQDPSHPAFWVKGQDEATLNMRGFWALDPCKQVGAGCGTGSECCNQNCDMGVCKEPDPNMCSQTGNVCAKTSDCCDPKAKCINSLCSEPPPP